MARRAINVDLLSMTPANRRRLQTAIATLEGEYSVSIEPRRATRSQRANAFYWAAVATPFADYLSDGGIKKFSKDEAHVVIKGAVLPHVQVIDPKTGEAIDELPADTHTMTTDEFCEFVERARAYLWEKYELPTADPDPELAGKKEAVKS
jgi:hypothetical protein